LLVYRQARSDEEKLEGELLNFSHGLTIGKRMKNLWLRSLAWFLKLTVLSNHLRIITADGEGR
jgi:hypothetical protein